MKRIITILIILTAYCFILTAYCSDALATDITISEQQLWSKKSEGRHKVTLTSYIPEGETKTAVIICPGGSYYWLGNKNEEGNMAYRLAENGIAAFVLHYRVAGKFNFITDFRWLYNGNRFPRMLEDIQQAIIQVRSNAEKYGIDPEKIGAMGFSAGGHLVMMAAESECYPANISSYSHPGKDAMPNFVAAIYPVVTMSDETVVHKRSRRALIGRHRNKEDIRETLSVEKHIPAECCPVFLLNSLDDDIVDYRNSEILDKALTESSIPHKYIQLPVGGHGFGVSNITIGNTSYDWTSEFLRWLKALKF